MMTQIALKEHDQQVKEPDERVLLDEQQTLSDAFEDIVDVPRIEIDTAADLSAGGAQQLHDRFQRKIDDLT
jgi:hypothetical protein